MIKEIEPNKPNPHIIDHLEALLERAKEGKITSLAYVYTSPWSGTGNAWAGLDGNDTKIIGELRILERDLIDLLVDIRINPRTGEEE